MRIKKILPFILLVFLFISCEKEDFEIETNNQRTVFMYLPWSTNYGHENEMYKEPMNLKRGKGVYMRELRECGGRTEDKTKCAKG